MKVADLGLYCLYLQVFLSNNYKVKKKSNQICPKVEIDYCKTIYFGEEEKFPKVNRSENVLIDLT